MLCCASTSIGQAQSSAGQLTALIQLILESNPGDFSSNGKPRGVASTFKVPNIDRDNDTVRAANDLKKKIHSESSKTVKENAQDADKESTDYQGPAFSFTFDQDLKNSRPYGRATKRNSTWSTASSVIHTVGWSCLSGLSLANISEISVIGLSTSSQEL